MENKFTDHHKVPQSYWWTNNVNNIGKVKDKAHQAFHVVFSNRTPVQQVASLLYINWSVLTREFKESIVSILAQYDDGNEVYAYRNWVLIPEKFIQAKQKYWHKNR